MLKDERDIKAQHHVEGTHFAHGEGPLIRSSRFNFIYGRQAVLELALRRRARRSVVVMVAATAPAAEWICCRIEKVSRRVWVGWSEMFQPL